MTPKARKDWPGCGSSVDGDEDEVVVDGAVEGVGEGGNHERRDHRQQSRPKLGGLLH